MHRNQTALQLKSMFGVVLRVRFGRAQERITVEGESVRPALRTIRFELNKTFRLH